MVGISNLCTFMAPYNTLSILFDDEYSVSADNATRGSKRTKCYRCKWSMDDLWCKRPNENEDEILGDYRPPVRFKRTFPQSKVINTPLCKFEKK